LLEVLLTLALLVAFAAAGAIALGPWRRSADFDEGVWRYDSMLRMARAEAARCGRRLRIEVRPDDGAMVVLWEPGPLEAPGQFVQMTDTAWAETIAQPLVRVAKCQLTGSSAYRTLIAVAAGDADGEIAPLTFYPDGSSDSATIELAGIDEEELRRAIVQLDGLSGIITTTVLTPSEHQEYLDGGAGQ
jgi:hypothetical protein